MGEGVVQLSSSDLVPPHGSIRIQAKSVRQGRKRKATWRCHRAAGPILFLILLPSCNLRPSLSQACQGRKHVSLSRVDDAARVDGLL